MHVPFRFKVLTQNGIELAHSQPDVRGADPDWPNAYRHPPIGLDEARVCVVCFWRPEWQEPAFSGTPGFSTGSLWRSHRSTAILDWWKRWGAALSWPWCRSTSTTPLFATGAHHVALRLLMPSDSQCRRPATSWACLTMSLRRCPMAWFAFGREPASR